MGTGHFVIESVLFEDAGILSLPIAGVEFHGLPGKIGDIVDIYSPTLHLQALHIPLIHGLETTELHAFGVGGQLRHLSGVDEWLFMKFI